MKLLQKNNLIEWEQCYSWYHSMFADAIKLTHTKNDMPEIVDTALLKSLSKSVINIVGGIKLWFKITFFIIS